MYGIRMVCGLPIIVAEHHLVPIHGIFQNLITEVILLWDITLILIIMEAILLLQVLLSLF
ncbi:MAG: hypothetical protein DRP57_12210 [Spirochaetes bacterium]|nr:MAG: hypothetical protein DRP57_12210 [Spirochaetota bacterium]